MKKSLIKHFSSMFLRGFFTLFPLLLSAYILMWFLNLAESIAYKFLLFFLPDSVYTPGLGILVAVLIIYLFGVMLDKSTTRKVFQWVEDSFQVIPLVRSIYRALKDFTDYLSPNKKRKNGRTVLVQMPHSKIELIGLVTRESLTDLPAPLGQPNYVAVYLPMSYQFGGYTIFVPRENIKEVPLGTEQAMRSVLTAWVSGQEEKND
ncbi:MAG: DUF502 domain-containing protein [Bdellovibrionales bacterium]|nr:DUF502 domain-containing protein [Bdellovibrionales bacterium]